MSRSPKPTILLTPCSTSGQFLCYFYLTADLSSLAVRERVRLNPRTIYSSRSCCGFCELRQFCGVFRPRHNFACASNRLPCANFTAPHIHTTRTGSMGRPPYLRMLADDTVQSLHRCAVSMHYSCTRYPWLVIEKVHAVGNVLVEFTTTTRHLARVECPSVLLLLAYADTRHVRFPIQSFKSSTA